jgi:hypothetical protein
MVDCIDELFLFKILSFNLQLLELEIICYLRRIVSKLLESNRIKKSGMKYSTIPLSSVKGLFLHDRFG